MHLSEPQHNKKNDCRLSRTQVDRMKSEMAAIVMALGIYIINVSTSLLYETID